MKEMHYTDTLMYSIDKTLKNIKFNLNQYILEAAKITAEQFAVLDTIYVNENICQQDVAVILSKDKSNIKRIVEILEKSGYITRQTGRKNNRLVNYLNITKSGEELIENNINDIRNYMKNFLGNITDEEVCCLEKIVLKLQNVNQNSSLQ